jgi:hypothetical protein
MTDQWIYLAEVSNMLADLNTTAKLEDHPEFVAGAQAVMVRRYGVDVWIVLAPWQGLSPTTDGIGILSFRALLGFVPSVGVAALFRKLLASNVALSSARFGLREQDDSLWLIQYPQVIRTTYVDLSVLKAGLDALVAVYHEHAPQVVKEFQLLQA